MSKNDLVIYHSVQGNTERVAKAIADELNCDLIKIIIMVPSCRPTYIIIPN